MTDQDDTHFAHCLTALRETDRDRYLACLLAPADKRGPLAALYAFNAEIARVRDVVREALPGEIRLQWWRDLLEGEADGDAMANPLAAGLMACVKAYQLPIAVLTDMIEARIFDVYNDPMESRASLEGYAGETASALIQLASLILGPTSAPASANAAGHAGVAQTVAGALLMLPIHRRRGQVYLPGDLLAATGVTPEALLDGRDTVAISRAIDAFIGLGREHFAKARAADGISPANRAAFAPVALVPHILDAAEKAGADIVEKPLQPSQWKRQWWMWRAMRRGPF